MRWGEALRNRIFEGIARHLSAPRAAAFEALLFGERALLDPELEERFRSAGVAHVLAVSGLHLGLLVGLFWWTLGGLGLSATGRYALIGAGVGLYLVLVGFKVSLVRAALLFAFVALGSVLKERGWITSAQIDPLQGLSLAGIVILFFDPQALFDVSFQLSFAATGSILLFLPALSAALERWRPSPDPTTPWARRALRAGARWGLALVGISLAAQAGVWPVIALHFHRLYAGTLLSNLLVVPLVTAILWLGVGLLLTLPWAGLAGLLSPPLTVLLGWLERLVTWLAGLPGMVVPVPAAPLGALGAYAAGLLWLARRVNRWATQRSSSSWALSSASPRS